MRDELADDPQWLLGELKDQGLPVAAWSSFFRHRMQMRPTPD